MRRLQSRANPGAVRVSGWGVGDTAQRSRPDVGWHPSLQGSEVGTHVREGGQLF